ncbi:MAG TPA: multicopper oxidase domain-containing protein [Longimicrobium sp.]|nr:multicopper oxidase domain-containing protein [Longimicrobium sp.]
MSIHLLSGPAPARPRPARVIAGVSAAGLAVLLAACAGASSSPSARPTAVGAAPSRPLVTAPGAALDTMVDPREIRSRNGVLNVTLAAVFKPLAVPNMGTQVLRTYQVLSVNDSTADSTWYGFPGPTLRVFPGDSVHIILKNMMWDSTVSAANPPGGASNTQCANYPASQPPRPTDHFEDCFHGLNWTNIHYHGMHVTPDSVGDDVLLLIPPGSQHEYGFRIPHNQSAGTHWYHPHKHGSVAIQVLNGMSGALIVDGGPLDTLADSSGMRERVIALQQIDTIPNLLTPSTFGHQFLVNGQLNPVIVMAPGEVQRWRIVNENVTKTAAFELVIADTTGDEPRIYEVARDGVAYANANYAPIGAPQPDASVLMAPGNRLDVFVQAPRNGGLFRVQTRHVAHALPQDSTRKEQFRARRATALPAGNAPADTSTLKSSVFYVMVDTTLPPSTSTLPSSLPPLPDFLANLPGPMNPVEILAHPERLPVIVFADSGFGSKSHQQPTQFFLGTAQNPTMRFNSDSVYVPRNILNQPLPMVLDSVQTWMVVNRSTATNHPFHIHINPFQVIDAFYPNLNDPNAPLYAQLDSAAQHRGAPIWLDVVPLPVPRVDTVAGVPTLIPGYVLIRQAYQPFLNADGTPCANCGDPTGWFVMHCHILGHEERGMMQVLEIVAPGQQPTPPPAGAGSAGPSGSGAASRPAPSAPGHSHRH